MRASARLISGYHPQQEHFTFTTPEDLQKMEAKRDEKIREADKRKEKAYEKLREKEKLKVVCIEQVPPEQVYLAVLETPLFKHVPSELDVQPSPEMEIAQDIEEGELVEEEKGSEQFTTDQSIVELHEHLLEYSLKLLASQGNAEEKYETIRWIWAPSVYGWVWKRNALGTYVRTPVPAKYLPFTFEGCCRITGYNPDRLRKDLMNEIRPILELAGFDYIIKQECLKS